MDKRVVRFDMQSGLVVVDPDEVAMVENDSCEGWSVITLKSGARPGIYRPLPEVLTALGPPWSGA